MACGVAMSVVVPVLDEAARIGAALDRLRDVAGIAEVIVVDGGSADGTRDLVRARPDVRLVEAARGRGTQMNAGARVATQDVLLFLHADVSVPRDLAHWVAGALADPTTVAGAFRIRTVADGPRPWWAPLLRLADVRSRVTRLPYGDQAVFVRRDAFASVGGFPDQPLMEDIELARRLRRLGRIATVPAEVEVSGRRVLAHPLRAMVTMRLLPILYRLGVGAETLARWYGNPR
jgi:rSAM/selenodomain-associated transferase 2